MWVLRQSKRFSLFCTKFATTKVFICFLTKQRKKKNPTPEQTSFSASAEDVCWLYWCLSRAEPRAPCAATRESHRVLPVPTQLVAGWLQRLPVDACLSSSWVTATSYLLPARHGAGIVPDIIPTWQRHLQLQQEKEEARSPPWSSDDLLCFVVCMVDATLLVLTIWL